MKKSFKISVIALILYSSLLIFLIILIIVIIMFLSKKKWIKNKVDSWFENNSFFKISAALSLNLINLDNSSIISFVLLKDILVKSAIVSLKVCVKSIIISAILSESLYTRIKLIDKSNNISLLLEINVSINS